MHDVTYQNRIFGTANATQEASRLVFPGFQPPTSNTTYTPNQFFDVCLRHYSRGVVRLVAYLIRKTLGWCDADGKPQEEQIRVSYRELIEKAGISRDMIRRSLDEAIAGSFIECVQEGKANMAGTAGHNAMYQLCWDPKPLYLKDPDLFTGFYEGEGNRTDIPNQFFDVVTPNEPLSVIKVVGSIIRFSIGFQARHGRRRTQVALSYDEIQRYANIRSREDLTNALRGAQERNYIVRLEKGIFDPSRDVRRKAVYALRWADFLSGQKSVPAAAESEIRTSNGQISEPAKQSEIRTNIQTKPTNETFKQHAEVADLEQAKKLLKGEGFSEKVAAKLAEDFTLEEIERQVRWLSHRTPSRNRLGFLRKAIEENWSAPEKLRISEVFRTPGFIFAQHFYAGFAGNQGEPISEPSPREADSSEIFVNRLLTVYPHLDLVPEWGRALGQLAREQRNPFPSLLLALRQFGDQLFVQLRTATDRERQIAIDQARQKHAEKYAEAYTEFLRAQECRYKTQLTSEYARFEARRADKRVQVLSDREPWNGPRHLGAYDSETRRLGNFQQFFALPDFWKWDTYQNPDSFNPSAL